MAGHLERRSPASSELQHGGPGAATGHATKLSEFSFTKKALIYADDMPTAFRQGLRASTEVELRSKKSARSGGELILASETPTVSAPRSDRETRKIEKAVIASGMRQLDKPRKSSARIIQRRIGWQATPELVVITTAERDLAKTPEGKLKPSGPWLIEDRRTYRNAEGKASKRTGNVPLEPSGTSQTKTSEPPGPEASVSEQFPTGMNALGLLPATVRASVIARVPLPTQFDGVILQESDAQGEPARLEVSVLRMDAERAVVIQASRKPSDGHWEVSQAIYRLQAPVIEQA